MVVLYFLVLWLWLAFPVALLAQFIVGFEGPNLGFALASSFLVTLLMSFCYYFGFS